MIIRKWHLFFLVILFPGIVEAQDPQFSQFYATPLYLNPAFAGASQLTRVGANYRNQWPSLDANFVSYSAWGDHYFDEKNSGVGLYVGRDQATVSGLNSTLVAGQYAYQLSLSNLYTLRAGFQAGYTFRNVDFSKFIFGDQINPDGTIDPTAESFDAGAVNNFFDIGAGLMLYSGRAWLGFSAFHLNQPNQSLIGEASPLPRKYSTHIGYKFYLTEGTIGEGLFSRPQERSIAPTAQYKFQGKFDQLDLGVYVTYEPIIFGIWYRGLPVKSVDGASNNEAIVFLVGLSKKTKKEILNIGYSFDVTLSNLGAQSGGAHEFSIAYAWFSGDPRKPPKNVRLIPCPNF